MASGQLGVLRRVAADLVPACLVGDQLVEARAHVEVGHQACGNEVDARQVVIEARPAVAAEVARRELALVALDEILALREPEVLLRHDHAGQARSGPALAARAVAVPQRLRIGDLVLHAAAEAGSGERLGHGDPFPCLPERSFPRYQTGLGRFCGSAGGANRRRVGDDDDAESGAAAIGQQRRLGGHLDSRQRAAGVEDLLVAGRRLREAVGARRELVEREAVLDHDGRERAAGGRHEVGGAAVQRPQAALVEQVAVQSGNLDRSRAGRAGGAAAGASHRDRDIRVTGDRPGQRRRLDRGYLDGG